MEEEQEDRSPSNSVGGEDETESDNQEEESGEAVGATNPTEGIENLGAPVTEAEAGAALDSVTVEVEGVGDMMTKGDVEVLTIESSPEWMGTLIEEETEME